LEGVSWLCGQGWGLWLGPLPFLRFLRAPDYLMMIVTQKADQYARIVVCMAEGCTGQHHYLFFCAMHKRNSNIGLSLAVLFLDVAAQQLPDLLYDLPMHAGGGSA
jgi:hypothetical protein